MIYDPNSYRDLQEIDNIWKTQKEKSPMLSDGKEAQGSGKGPGHALRPIRHAVPRRDSARASLYQKDQRPEPVWNTGGHLPPARPCSVGPSPLGKILQNFQGHGLLSLSLSLSLSFSLCRRIIPAGVPRRSSTSLIRLRVVFRVLLLFSPGRVSISARNKISSAERTLLFADEPKLSRDHTKF